MSGCPGEEIYIEVQCGMFKTQTKPCKRILPRDPQTGHHLLELKDLVDIPGEFDCIGAGRCNPLKLLQPIEPSQQMDVIISIWSRFGA